MRFYGANRGIKKRIFRRSFDKIQSISFRALLMEIRRRLYYFLFASRVFFFFYINKYGRLVHFTFGRERQYCIISGRHASVDHHARRIRVYMSAGLFA